MTPPCELNDLSLVSCPMNTLQLSPWAITMNQVIRTLNPLVAEDLATAPEGARVKAAFAQRVVSVFQDAGYKVLTRAPGLSFIQSKDAPNVAHHGGLP